MQELDRVLEQQESPALDRMEKIRAALGNLPWGETLRTAAGSFAGISLVAWLTYYFKLPLLAPSFGATAVLLYAACHVPMAQPRNAIGGHLISAALGVLTFQLFGQTWWSIALGVTLAITAMVFSGTLHPPGGATAFVAVYTGQDFSFVFAPIAVGVILMVLVALVTNNLGKGGRYPAG
ncbi:MAG: HPP family protein [Clostridia bacterium]|nr:HPP family protein [Clostridia bacterium]